MKLKKEYVILFALIALLSVYLIKRNPNQTQYKMPVKPDIKRGDFDKIEITSQKGVITLEKKDDHWVIDPKGFLVEQAAVDRMLDALQKIKLTALVSEAKDYQRYELDGDKKISVKAWAGGKEVRDLDVGKTASSFRHTFVKFSGDDRVYQAEGNFQASFNKTAASLRDKTVLAFDQGDIQDLTITRAGQSLTLNRKKAAAPAGKEDKSPESKDKHDQWQTPDGKPGDRAKIDELLSNLANLHCDSYLEGKKKADLTDPIYTVDLKGGKTYHLALFEKEKKDAKAYPGISSGNDYPFLIPDWRAKEIMRLPDDLLVHEATEKPAAAPAAKEEKETRGAKENTEATETKASAETKVSTETKATTEATETKGNTEAKPQ